MAPTTETRNLYLAIAGLMLVVGFGAGYIAGTEQVRHSAPAAPPESLAMADVPRTADGMPEPRRGHTFTGEVDVPPHGELGHKLAGQILGEVACPCGGCTDMTIGECTCDVAREAEGLAAHLFERGKNGAQVLGQLGTRYGFQVPAAVLAKAEKVGAPMASSSGPPAAASGGGLLDLVDRPLDVPTSARPKP